MYKIIVGDCMDKLDDLEDGSVDLCLTSPPYANQRSGESSTGCVLYSGVTVNCYPDWVCQWMSKLRKKMKMTGSVLIVARSHIRRGEVSDYILRTRLAVRDNGWKECEELIWYKPDAPPLGSNKRPRRTFEQILWFSLTGEPYCDLYACGKDSDRTGGFVGSDRFGEGVITARGQKKQLQRGTSRVTDIFTAAVGSLPKNVMHPAMYPVNLTNALIRTFSPPGGHVLDPFCGSGQTGISAISCGRIFTGIDIMNKYADMAENRLKVLIADLAGRT